ncbi:MAG TPA: hypothetical protein PK323_06480 [Bacteroidia bacterium]|nr:hypothetical protein [Bacteroidia bacterium]
MSQKTILNILIAIIISFEACKKDEPVTEENIKENPTPTPTPTPTQQLGNINIDFDNVVGSNDLVLNTSTYTNAAGNTFNVSKFIYYISNIKLTKIDGNKFIEKESYYLINEANTSSLSLSIDSIPVGDYNAIELTIGVDSVRNVSGAQTGALDPANDMFWTWNSGYIFLKMEGTSSSASGNDLTFHIGGFNSPNNTIRTITRSFPTNLTVKSTNVSKVKMKTDVLEMFTYPQNIDFSTFNFTMGGPTSVTIADNYVDMITVKEIINN